MHRHRLASRLVCFPVSRTSNLHQPVYHGHRRCGTGIAWVSWDVIRQSALTVLGVLIVLGIVWISLQPYRPLPTRHGAQLHELAHIIGFGSAALLLCATRRTRRQEWWIMLALFGIAVILETAQYLSENNIFEWGDVLDDSVGILVFPMFLRYRKLKSWLSGEAPGQY